MDHIEPSIDAYVDSTRNRSWRRGGALALLFLSLAATTALALLYGLRSERSGAIGRFPPGPLADEYEWGYELYLDERYGPALDVFLSLRRIAPESADVAALTASTYAHLGDYFAALPHAAAAVDLEPEYPTWVALHAHLLHDAGLTAESAESMRGLRGTEPPDPFAARWMADLFALHGETEERLRAATAGLRREPDDAELLAHRLEALLDLGRLAEARELVAGLSR
jgi:predicted Zn-dependent protease